MANCVHCGSFIDTANPQEIFYTVRIGEYECNACHNADINIEAIITEDNRVLSPAEIFVILLFIIISISIIYFGFIKG